MNFIPELPDYRMGPIGAWRTPYAKTASECDLAGLCWFSWPFTGYAVGIDNVTKDPPTLLPLASLNEAGEGVWLLPSSARVHGAGGAFYTTDLTIANVCNNDAPFTLKYLGNNQEGRTGIEKRLMLSAGMSVTYTDALGSIFGVTEGFGAIRVTSSNSGLAVSAQTSTPSGDGGTFGQSVPAAACADLIEGNLRWVPSLEIEAAFRRLTLTFTSVRLDQTLSLRSAYENRYRMDCGSCAVGRVAALWGCHLPEERQRHCGGESLGRSGPSEVSDKLRYSDDSASRGQTASGTEGESR
jgi:hypothetical protein